ncbi:restriction endonuclease subunit S [Bradyrhizobium sp. JYMT SZCCT0428]|nr:restriction endonuclease subunit S [Bradyrhizobium sp. JYMT SZCCT0428]
MRGASPRPIDDPRYFDEEGEYAWVRISDVSSSRGVLWDAEQRLSLLGSSLSVKLEPGNLFVSIAGTVGKPCITAIKVCIHDGFVYFPRLDIDPHFLYRVFEAGQCYAGLGKLGTQLNLNTDTIGSIRVPIPPPQEMQHIVDFLDRETTKIDALVKEQQRLIELLEEKRQAAVSRAVTKGLGANVPMKRSGIEWLGDVPDHWDIIPLRALFRFVKRQNGDALEVLSVYRDYGVITKASRNDNINKTPDDLTSYQTVYPGDLVVNKMKAWQGSLGISTHEGITSPDYAVFQPTHNGDPEYLNWLLRCRLLPDKYRSISNGIRPDQWRLEPDRFKELKIPFPPLIEQREIATNLRSFVKNTDDLCGQAEKAVDLLLQRRRALISAAVTGKIDVRGQTEAAASIPDVVAA